MVKRKEYIRATSLSVLYTCPVSRRQVRRKFDRTNLEFHSGMDPFDDDVLEVKVKCRCGNVHTVDIDVYYLNQEEGT